ncbi:TonB-dependent siderophore receptor [Sandaracinobacter sp. RS1-74]|uniref:TonB-dependent receptor n=1 Tax=Sandaracinobacteroides sayramensis TaxID=2913411 RepID=UPI001EDC4F4B|nr:TonB-dependent siderophore receptor [Sandaracinobacteroides sayramensis]MCG2840148.1 TonB-dependent siderophore receptor [Sandaracinobacteroides sayramensis]
MMLATPAAAADFAPETIIVTGAQTGEFGAKSAIPLERMPQSVQLLDSQELIDRGVRSMGDALRAVPSANAGGARISRYQSFGLKIRGFAADQMRNGIRQRYYEDVDASALSNIDRIEVLKGPSAVLFGQSAVGGLISIVTKRPTDSFEASAALTGGSYGQKMATIDMGGPVSGHLGIRLTGEIERSGSFVDHQDMDRENVGLMLRWAPSPDVSAHLVGEYVRRATVNNPGLPVVGTVLENGVGRVRRGAFLGEPEFTDLVADAVLIQAWVDFRMADNWVLTPRFQFNQFNTSLDQIRLLAPRPGSRTLIQRNGRRGREDDDYYIGQVDLAGQFLAGGVIHKLLVGVEYSADRPSFLQHDIVPGGVPPIDSMNPVPAFGKAGPELAFTYLSLSSVNGFAAYAQDQIALSDRWDLVAGLRHSLFDYDNRRNGVRNADSFSNTSWQLGSHYRLGGGFSLYGGYNSGFDLEPVVGARSKDGTPFKPETSDQIEAALRLARGGFSGSLSVFRIRRNNVATADPQDPNYEVQEGQLRSRGLEIEGEWVPLPGWWLQGGYAHIDGRVTRNNTPGLKGAWMGDTPRNTATLSTRVALGGSGIELRGGAYYVGERALVNGSDIILGDYLLLDIGAGARFGNLSLDAALTNLTDRTYYTANGGANFVYPGDPRMLSVRLGYRF